jgi:hypothetical protein
MGLKLLPVVLSLIAGSADVIGFFGLGGLTKVLVASHGADRHSVAYHCHLLSREDKGMMATIEVVR